jgi:hypothetical protein
MEEGTRLFSIDYVEKEDKPDRVRIRYQSDGMPNFKDIMIEEIGGVPVSENPEGGVFRMEWLTWQGTRPEGVGIEKFGDPIVEVGAANLTAIDVNDYGGEPVAIEVSDLRDVKIDDGTPDVVMVKNFGGLDTIWFNGEDTRRSVVFNQQSQTVDIRYQDSDTRFFKTIRFDGTTEADFKRIELAIRGEGATRYDDEEVGSKTIDVAATSLDVIDAGADSSINLKISAEANTNARVMNFSNYDRLVFDDNVERAFYYDEDIQEVAVAYRSGPGDPVNYLVIDNTDADDLEAIMWSTRGGAEPTQGFELGDIPPLGSPTRVASEATANTQDDANATANTQPDDANANQATDPAQANADGGQADATTTLANGKNIAITPGQAGEADIINQSGGEIQALTPDQQQLSANIIGDAIQDTSATEPLDALDANDIALLKQEMAAFVETGDGSADTNINDGENNIENTLVNPNAG